MTYSQEQIDEALKSLNDPTDLPLVCPFPTESVLDGNVVIPQLENVVILSMDDLTINGDFEFKQRSLFCLNLEDTHIKGDFSVVDSTVTDSICMCGVQVEGEVKITCSQNNQINRITCDPWQAQALHYAAPTTPLVMKGCLIAK